MRKTFSIGKALSVLLALCLLVGTAALPVTALNPGETVSFTYKENVFFESAWNGADPDAEGKWDKYYKEPLNPDGETWLSYRFHLEEAGTYTFTWDRFRWKEEGRLVEIRMDGTPVGRVDNSRDWTGGNSNDLATAMATDNGSAGTPGTTTLEAGDHILTFAVVGYGYQGEKNPNEWRFYWEGFTLTAAEDAPDTRTVYRATDCEDPEQTDVSFTHQDNGGPEGPFSRADLTAVGQKAAYQFNADQEGLYTLTIRYRTHETTGQADVMVNGQQVGHLAPEGAMNSCHNLVLENVLLHAGENTVSFVATTPGTNNAYGVNIFTFTLDWVAQFQPLTISLGTKTAAAHTPDSADDYDLTWNVSLANQSLEDSEQDFKAFNEKYEISEAGVVIAQNWEDLDDHAMSLIQNEPGAEEAADRKAYKEAFEGTTIYTNFSYRRIHVTQGRQRAIAVYVVYYDREDTGHTPLYALTEINEGTQIRAN